MYIKGNNFKILDKYSEDDAHVHQTIVILLGELNTNVLCSFSVTINEVITHKNYYLLTSSWQTLCPSGHTLMDSFNQPQMDTYILQFSILFAF